MFWFDFDFDFDFDSALKTMEDKKKLLAVKNAILAVFRSY